jgi:hypothetical protein
MERSIYLASRGDGPEDFDGRGVRQCAYEMVDEDVLRLTLDVPIHCSGLQTVPDGTAVAAVLVHPRHVGKHLPPCVDEVVAVHAAPVATDPSTQRRSTWWGDVAFDPTLFSHTYAEAWVSWVQRLRAIGERTGGTWVVDRDDLQAVEDRTLLANMRHLASRPEEITELESLPGWRWLDDP